MLGLTSFAATHDQAAQAAESLTPGYTGAWHRANNHAGRPLALARGPLTGAWTAANGPIRQPGRPAPGTAPQPSRRLSAAERRRNGASEDGQGGGLILDAFINAAFPGFGIFFAPLSVMDAVEVYDQTRDILRRPAQRRRAPAFMFG
jgi:hypothetical protein